MVCRNMQKAEAARSKIIGSGLLSIIQFAVFEFRFFLTRPTNNLHIWIKQIWRNGILSLNQYE